MKNLREWCIEQGRDHLLELYENAKNEYKSNEIGFSSGKNVNWKCSKCGMEWKQKPNKMNKKKAEECPYCAHERASFFYNVESEFPILAEEWDNKLNDKTPDKYTPQSHARVFWKCKNGHSWNAVIRDRVRSIQKRGNSNKAICPYCNHERASSTYNLFTEAPDVARQWNYIKNGEITPLQITPKSSKKVWWVCEYNPNHVWQDKVSNRTALHRGCPECSKIFTISFPSRAIYYYLKSCFNDCQMEHRILKKYVLDIYLPYYKIAIEYDGWYYHLGEKAKQREEKKDEAMKENGINIIRIKEQKENIKDISLKDNIIDYPFESEYSNLNELIKKVIDIIQEKTNIQINKDVDFKRDYQKIEDLYYHVRKSNSLAVKKPEHLKEWSNNNEILPDTISTCSSYRIKWICPKCNREYEATPYNRIRNHSNCPYCAHKKKCKNI